jgi:Zn-dependent protease
MRGVTLFRVWGIKVRVDWTWSIAFVLVGVMLGASAFPSQAPRAGAVAYAAMAVVATLLFFLSILLHELGHALQGSREGVQTEDITLWVFGGVARMRQTFPSPPAELRIALAGPAVTLGLMGVFGAAAAGLGPHSPTGGVAAWLAYINGVLLVFNLVPAFPLDGGRVLHALLWRRRRDSLSATETAASAGRAFAYLLIGLGVVSTLIVDVVGGLWLVMLGWFLSTAASAEAQHSRLVSMLAGVHVRDVMVPQPDSVEAGWTLEELSDGIADGARYTVYPVVENGAVVGLLPLAAVVRRPRETWADRRVRDEMIALEDAPSVEDDEFVADALGSPGVAELGRALVRHRRAVVGLLSVTDVERRLRGATR